MKIKNDFVTNSSSSSFILSIAKGEVSNFKEYMKALGNDPDAYNEGVSIHYIGKSIRGLRNYTNGRPFDWASKPMGLNYENMDEEMYNVCKEAIDGGNAAVFVRVDWNVCDKFRRKWPFHIVWGGDW